ncbi:MAG: SDR family oxidoreductase [Coriobacteriia bacterium]|nr:SDR family oxidoreductase [Coriobacteriia bacterium]
MRILIVGAESRLGREVAVRALGHGHEVRALTSGGPLAVANDRLDVIHGDPLDFDVVNAAVRGVSGVAVVLPEGGGAYEGAIANIIHAMAENMSTRLVAESAVGAFARGDSRLPLAKRFKATTVRRRDIDELEAMERRIVASDLDWTIVRPFGLTDDPPRGQYRVSLSGEILSAMKPVPRADVASVMVKALETDTYWRRVVTVAG